MKDMEKTLLLVKVYLHLVGIQQRKPAAFKFIQTLGYTSQRRTLNRQIALLNGKQTISTRTHKAGAKCKLDEDQQSDLHAWVLQKNAQNEAIGPRDVQTWVDQTYSIQFDIQTARNYLRKLKLTRKSCQVRSAGFKHPKPELRAVMLEFVARMKENDWFGYRKRNITSIDVTYTKRPTKRLHTYSPKGSGTQKSAKQAHLYTDAIVTMVSADGKNRAPCVLYTFNPKMSLAQKNTKRGKMLRRALLKALKKYGIAKWRVVYTKSKKHFSGENPAMYRDFLTRNGVPKKSLILHDGGRAFKEGPQSIFDQMGYEKHVVYPSCVHEYLSPNDNSLHGCKSTWEREYHKFESSVEASLRLMQLLDLDTVKHSKGYFKRNQFDLTETSVAEIIPD